MESKYRVILDVFAIFGNLREGARYNVFAMDRCTRADFFS